MKTRKSISKALRFQVFARDGFTCRYCGKQSDSVSMVIDHMIPVCQGGTNDIENLCTACEPCNAGKSGKTIAQSAPTETDRLRIAQERNEQLEAAHAAAAAAQARQGLRQTVCNYFCTARGTDEMDKRTLDNLVSYVSNLGADLVFSWIDLAVSRVGPDREDKIFGMYVSGCRRQWLAEQEVHHA